MIVTHFKKDGLASSDWKQFELLNQSTVWETCVRVLGLTMQNQAHSHPNSHSHLHDQENLKAMDVFRGSQAYHFLLRVASGLESPILGETEVFGQFKNWLEQSPKWQQLGKMILEDVKLVRRQYLEGLGAQSYGSWARKKLENQSHVMMVGCGQLGQEILPWLAKSERAVTVVVRDETKYQQFQSPSVQVMNFSQVQEWAGALLIMAPLSEQQLNSILAKSSFRLIVDLRDNSGKFWGQRIDKPSPVFTLEDAFSDLKKFRELGQSQIAQAEQKLKELAHQRAQSVVNRPFGWDDLCA